VGTIAGVRHAHRTSAGLQDAGGTQRRGRVVWVFKGRIEQVDTPTEVYDNPANAFVYQFLKRLCFCHTEESRET
jgi:ABC-type sulfate/molybdate transport systems ATPase subunit